MHGFPGLLSKLALDELEVVAVDLHGLVLVGEHSNQLITRRFPICTPEDPGTGDIGMLHNSCEVRRVAVELELILGWIEIGDVGVVVHALGGIEALLFTAEHKDIAAPLAGEHIHLSTFRLRDRANEEVIGFAADHAVATD